MSKGEEIPRSVLDDMRQEFGPIVTIREFDQVLQVRDCKRCDIENGKPCCSEHWDIWRTIAVAMEEWQNRPILKDENE